LKELFASNNKISLLPESIKDLTYLETIRLDGNPICVSNPGLSSCFGKDVGREITKFFKTGVEASSPGIGGGGFLDSGINDAAALRKKVAELQLEIKKLKATGGPSEPVSVDTLDSKRSWMTSTGPSSGFGGMERPTTAASQAKQL